MMSLLMGYIDGFAALSINEATFARYVGSIEMGYKNNPYHNAAHAADVVQVRKCVKLVLLFLH